MSPKLPYQLVNLTVIVRNLKLPAVARGVVLEADPNLDQDHLLEAPGNLDLEADQEVVLHQAGQVLVQDQDQVQEVRGSLVQDQEVVRELVRHVDQGVDREVAQEAGQNLDQGLSHVQGQGLDQEALGGLGQGQNLVQGQVLEAQEDHHHQVKDPDLIVVEAVHLLLKVVEKEKILFSSQRKSVIFL